MAELNSFLTSIADAIRSKKGTTDKINASNFASEIASISGGGGAVIKTIGGWQGTAVPNSGTISKIYFNTNLSIEETANILNSVDYISTDGYSVCINSDFSKNIFIIAGAKYPIVFNAATYEPYFVGDEETAAEIGITNLGWQINELEFNDTPLNEMEGIPIGTNNNLLSSAISTTPFTKEEGKIIEELSGVYEPITLTVEQDGTTELLEIIKNENKIPTTIKTNLITKFITNYLIEYSNETLTEGLKDYAFAGNFLLEKVSLPNIYMTYNYQFLNCTSLKEVNLDKVTRIEQYTFSNCRSLANISLPCVEQIIGYAFHNCTSLTDIYCGSNMKIIMYDSNGFVGCTLGVKIHVRSEYASQYAEDTYWKPLIDSGQVVIVGDYTD